MLMRLFFIWLFVSERKQTTLMADEGRLEMEENAKILKSKIFA